MEMGFIAYPRSFGGFSESKQQLTFIRVCGDAAHLLPLIECGQIGTHKSVSTNKNEVLNFSRYSRCNAVTHRKNQKIT
jgi:hypothetical protein